MNIIDIPIILSVHAFTLLLTPRPVQYIFVLAQFYIGQYVFLCFTLKLVQDCVNCIK